MDRVDREIAKVEQQILKLKKKQGMFVSLKKSVELSIFLTLVDVPF